MKKKFISVAMFCALIASSPVWVGCSDYDDDIANLQSQVDALKQTVDVSTAEALKALQEAQAALQEDINELTAGKADAQAVKDLQRNRGCTPNSHHRERHHQNRRIEFSGQRTDRTGKWNRRRFG